MTRIDGLASGFDTTAIINSILEVERISVLRLEDQIRINTEEKTVFLGISAKLLAAQTRAKMLGEPILFDASQVTSSNDSVLSATVGEAFSLTGSFQFTSKRLASSDQFVSKGFASAEQTFAAGQISFEVGQGSVAKDTELSLLNGGQGITAGSFQIRDKSGASTVIDLSSAVSVNDVIDAINSSSNISVRAELNASGDGIQVTDLSGGAGNLEILDVSGGSTAAELQLAGSTAGTVLGDTGNLSYITGNTLLSQLNDGRGVRIAIGSDFDITLSDGSSTTVNLDGATTIQDVLDAVNAADPSLTAAIAADGKGLTITDSLGGASQLTIDDTGLSNAATDLGLAPAVSTALGLGSVDGRAIMSGLNTVLLSSLNGGNGIALGSIDVTDRAGNLATIDLSSAETLQDVINTINANGVAQVSAAVNDGKSGLKIIDESGGTGSLIINENGSTTAADLGIENGTGVTVNDFQGSNLQFQYVSENTRTENMNGGAGVYKGSIKITDKLGTSYTISLAESNNNTLDGIIQDIDGITGGNVVATINANGDGLLLTDTTGGSLSLKVEEVDGSTARDLNILGSTTDTFIDGSYETTVDIEAGDTLEDVSRKINDAGGNVTSSVLNDGSSTNPYRLNLLSNLTGTDGQLSFDFSALGVSFDQASKAQDALLQFGSSSSGSAPLILRSSTNSFKNVLPSMDIDVFQVSSTPITITASKNYDEVANQMQGLVDALNSALETVDDVTSFNPDNFDSGILLGDSTVNNIENSILRKFTTRLYDLEGSIKSITQLGVHIEQNGKFSFDKNDLLEKLNSDPDSVKEFLSKRETITDGAGKTSIKRIGFSLIIEDLLKSFTDSVDGAIQTRAAGLDSRNDDLADRVESRNEEILSMEERLVRRFANLEVIMSRANATMDRLSSSLVALEPRRSSRR